MRIVPIILCGGSGTRLWPLSRRDFAKQHAPVLGGASPFQRTLARVAEAGGADWTPPLVITGAPSRFMAAEQARAAGITAELVLEPEGRDTLAAITLGTLIAARHGPEAVALILPSDHLIPDTAAFAAAVAAAGRAAAAGALVTFGVAPTGPATGYGYIRPASPAAGAPVAIAEFVEKPDADRAEALIGQGCLWNSGMFALHAETTLGEIRALAPDCYAAVARGLTAAEEAEDALVIGRDFASAPKISFDYAVMEKTRRALVLPVGFGWSDIGDWREVWNLVPRDADGVGREGPVATRDVKDSYIRADGKRLVCALGLERVLIVDTPDALLVADLDRAQEVKQLVAGLQAEGRPESTTPARVHRPWGWYQTMDLGDRFRVKRIQVAPGKQLSLQRHHHRAEHWIVVRGTAEVTRDGETTMVRENESIYLPMGCLHRLRNPGKIGVEIVEVQTGAYLEEDDIVRVEDDFGRAKAG
ncbi:MAG: mannose-1-phosphate guanylyltransferase/mannose-6-phosphate isomerase [Rhodovulum sulfidophilum]|uniref:mannose-1-phosphate guanylyltransferase n=1 Tax=Rhodovulum sulfidophilum TaxID=35806 RepID=A0A2W5N586_RHOSU|nr:MAG: mannose-1-phosphate guanylyltransferase/mannose-6-phosphate isomerase [Rhodovulum sulfidophilum]